MMTYDADVSTITVLRMLHGTVKTLPNSVAMTCLLPKYSKILWFLLILYPNYI